MEGGGNAETRRNRDLPWGRQGEGETRGVREGDKEGGRKREREREREVRGGLGLGWVPPIHKRAKVSPSSSIALRMSC
eukprot:1364985-Amorphochlora_amoeboformis.AAC.1